ncbi:hypothetical protein GCT13_27490 [Paraburkholderia sp. CNPSo 3157]|uniref:Uncharacterized protein n=1 Tax=Paraburkholderia franconis TaxID=2654983 RepID=A0A7X1NEI7_9BURK|nr:hypothetical protein [Paraburkholderia franconis]MPW20523.1 hypothetical protein [Paraburkholderia franconis]
MPSKPSAEPTDKPLDPAQSPTGTKRKAAAHAPAKTKDADRVDADAAEPVPHEHLPSRSDDN